MTDHHESLLRSARRLLRLLESNAPDCLIGHCIWHLFVQAAGRGLAVTTAMTDWIRVRARVSAGLCAELDCTNAINPRFSDLPLCEWCDAREHLLDDSLDEADLD